MKCDVETLEIELLNLVKSKITAKLAEIDAEKADSITLEVPTDEQYFNTTDDEVNVSNQTMNVQYGIVDGSPLSISSSTAEDNRYIFLVYLNELNQVAGVLRKKLFRYVRAFKEIFEENFDAFPHISNMTVQTIAPQSWAENEESPVYKVGGVYIQTSIVG